MPNLLIVDDEPYRTESLRRELMGSDADGYDVEWVKSWTELKAKLNRCYQRFDLIVFDVDFSHAEDSTQLLRATPPADTDAMYQGYLLLKALREWEKGHWQEQGKPPQFIKVICHSWVVPNIAGRESELDEYFVETYSYTEASAQDERLVKKIHHLCPARDSQRIEGWKKFSGIVCGNNRKMYELMHQAETIALQKNCHVWIDGPTGVGKELIARFIHQKSPRVTDLGAILTRLLKELKQLNELGAGIFSQEVKTLQHKINADLAQSLRGFGKIEEELGSGRTEDRSDNRENLPQTIKELERILDDAQVGDELKQRINQLGKDSEKLGKGFKNQEYYVAQCLYQVANLWQKSQQQNDSTQGLFNFFDMNCATFPDDKDLLVNLFGVPAGVYTDVRDARPGVLKATSYMYGTLFLDEIAELSPKAQAVLLRVLQEQKLRRINSNISEEIDVRIVAATNQNIYKLVREEKFREDLLMRLMQAKIEVPPLMERMEDFDELADFFLKRKQDEYQTQDTPSPIPFDPQGNALSYMKAQGQPWRGNVRALRNVVERAYETARIEGSGFIDTGHVRKTLDILKKVKKPAEEQRKGDSMDEISIETIEQWLGDAVSRLGVEHCTHENLQTLIRWLAERFFQQAVDHFAKTGGNWNQTYARIAEIMKMDRKPLLNNKELISLKMRDLLDELLKPDVSPKEEASNGIDNRPSIDT